MENFLKNIYSWYKKNRRDLPWRETTDPYKIWISEVILQQTRVVQGISYYHRFIERFPTVTDLASAEEDDVLRMWQGLGYYSRARNLHASARQIINRNGGVFPETFDALLELKGIGVYTAAAIASFAFNLPYAAVDGNVSRVLARLYGITVPVNSERGKRHFQQLAQSIVPVKYPVLHNQALMEFGALQCIPGLPDCSVCPVRIQCHAFMHHQTGQLPRKIKSSPRRNRYFNYYLIEQGDHIWLQKRTAKDIWQNLYQLPLVETDKELAEQEVMAMIPPFLEGCSLQFSSVTGSFKHILSHQTIFARGIEVVANSECGLKNDFFLIPREDTSRYALPKLVVNILRKLL